jgi:ATP-dependent Clp protease protease subunit
MVQNQEVIIEEFSVTKPPRVPDNAPVPIIQLEQELDIKNRLIYLTNIDIYTPSFIRQRADTIFQMSNDNTTPITIVISSYGGEVYGMFGVIDVINRLPVKVNTLGVGTVQSAATTILASGTGKRTLTKNTFVMIHQISTWLGGQTDDIANEMKHTKELQGMLYAILGEKSKQPAKFWEKTTKKNLYLPAAKCLEFGLVDEVI